MQARCALGICYQITLLTTPFPLLTVNILQIRFRNKLIWQKRGKIPEWFVCLSKVPYEAVASSQLRRLWSQHAGLEIWRVLLRARRWGRYGKFYRAGGWG